MPFRLARWFRCSVLTIAYFLLTSTIDAEEISYPPQLPDGKTVATDSSEKFLTPMSSLVEGVTIAKTKPTVDFLYYPKQTYKAKTWSVWGDGSVANGKYYSAIGDHDAPAGNAFVYEYDPKTKNLRTLLDLKGILDQTEGHYSPSKIHSKVEMGSDGWLYFSTHRGSTRVTIDKFHYKGDWLVRHNPKTGQSEVVTHAPVPKRCLPTGMIDPDRLIFYGGTAHWDHKVKDVDFFAYDLKNRKLLYSGPNGPYRYLIFARSTGTVYYTPTDEGPLFRFNPEVGKPVQIEGNIGLRSATDETADGYVYTVSSRGDAKLWQFNTKTEQIKQLDSAVVGTQSYITSIDVDPSGKFLYYIPGAHGGSQKDGTPVVQFDIKNRSKKVIAFLHPFYVEKFGFTPLGSFSSALSPEGDKLYITWNGSRSDPNKRGRLEWNTCALTVVHIPKEERK